MSADIAAQIAHGRNGPAPPLASFGVVGSNTINCFFLFFLLRSASQPRPPILKLHVLPALTLAGGGGDAGE